MAFLETFRFNRGQRSIPSLAAFNASINAYFDHLVAHRGCNFQRNSITSVRHRAIISGDASTAVVHQLHYLSICHCYYSCYLRLGLSFADSTGPEVSSAIFGSEHGASFCYHYTRSC